MTHVDRPIYTIRLRPEPGVDGIKSLRFLLKRALRWGLKCVHAAETSSTSTTITTAIEGLKW
jgi:hypothetical protein